MKRIAENEVEGLRNWAKDVLPGHRKELDSFELTQAEADDLGVGHELNGLVSAHRTVVAILEAFAKK